MFDVAFLIIAIPIIFIIYCIQKGKEQAVDRSIHDAHTNLIAIKMDINDERRELEELGSCLDNRWGMAESLSNDIEYIFGNRWRDILRTDPRPKKRNQGFYSSASAMICPWDIVIQVYFAYKYHKIPTLHDGKYLLGQSYVGQDEKIRACQIIEKYVKIQHPDYNILFDPGSERDWSECGYGRLIWDKTYLGSAQFPLKRPW